MGMSWSMVQPYLDMKFHSNIICSDNWILFYKSYGLARSRMASLFIYICILWTGYLYRLEKLYKVFLLSFSPVFPIAFLLRVGHCSLSVPSLRGSLLPLCSFFALLATPCQFLLRDDSFFATPCGSLLIRCPLILPARSLFVAPYCFWLIAWHLLFATPLWSTYHACFSFTVYDFSFSICFLCFSHCLNMFFVLCFQFLLVEWLL